MQLDLVQSIPFLVLTNQRETLVDSVAPNLGLEQRPSQRQRTFFLPSLFFSEVSRTYLVPPKNRRIPVIKRLQEKSQMKAHAIADVSVAVTSLSPPILILLPFRWPLHTLKPGESDTVSTRFGKLWL